MEDLLENDCFNERQKEPELEDMLGATTQPQISSPSLETSTPEPTPHWHPQDFPSNFLSQDNEALLSLPTIAHFF